MSTQGGKVASEIVDKNDGSYVSSFIPCEAGQHSVTVRINREKLGEISPIPIKERSFTPVRFIGEEKINDKNLSLPWGVAVNDSNEIFISDMNNNRIVVMNAKEEFIRSFGQGLVDDPRGISIDSEGRAFVVSKGNNKIYLFNSNGEYVRVVNNVGSLNEPRGISLDSRGNVIVCDTGNKCIKILSPEGNTFKTIGKGWLQFPTDCLCYKDKIFVSDRKAHLIKAYNSNGGFLYDIGKKGNGDGELYEPTGLAVDKTGHLLVCSGGNDRVQVFTLRGKFVTKFGAYGVELGQLNQPFSASVLKSGHIVVCELGNNRLQVFE